MAHQEAVDDSYFFRKAESDGVNPAIIVGECHVHALLANHKYWDDVKSLEDISDVYAREVNILAGMDDPIANFSRSIAEHIQFPESSVYLHALGVMSAIMVPNFFYRFNDMSEENTVALYTIVAQPPSTGKSGVNNILIDKANECFKVLATKNEIEREILKHEIKKLEGETKGGSDNAIRQIIEQITNSKEKLSRIPMYRWYANDPTPEGCEDMAIGNNGFFNVVSDESSALKVALGLVYGGNDAKNNGLFLKAWDNGYHEVARQSRAGLSGRVRGAVAVLAQDASINSILSIGREGEGVSERFLLLREKTLLGRRDRKRRVPLDTKAKEIYERLVESVVMAGRMVLQPSVAALNFLDDFGQEIEPKMGDGGQYSANMLRGVVGKADKQIVKIASVLHVAKNWSGAMLKSNIIEQQTIVDASIIFTQLLKTYVAAADSRGFTGMKTETAMIIEKLRVRIEKKNNLKIKVQELRNLIHKSQPFSEIPKLNDQIRTKYIPVLEDNNYVVYDKTEDTIYINPKLRG